MARPKLNYEDEIFNLLTSKFKSTNEIAELGKSKGLYNRWESYNKVLHDLLEKGKVEVAEIPKKIKVQKIWRKR